MGHLLEEKPINPAVTRPDDCLPLGDIMAEAMLDTHHSDQLQQNAFQASVSMATKKLAHLEMMARHWSPPQRGHPEWQSVSSWA